MQYITHYASPLGDMLLAADEEGLTGVWFEGEKYYADNLAPDYIEGTLPVLDETRHWLEVYFAGQEPEFMPSFHLMGSDFQIAVWNILQLIPYGKTTTYGAIAKEAAERLGRERMSAQAVGGAVGHNHLSILIPCHRVVGSDGSLTGYAGGIDKKRALLQLERADTNRSNQQ